MNADYIPYQDKERIEKKTIGQSFLVEIISDLAHPFKIGDKVVAMEYKKSFNMDAGDLFIVPCKHNDILIKKNGSIPSKNYSYHISGMYLGKHKYKKYAPVNEVTINTFKRDDFYEQ